ncbi:hypothetical protein LCGC14_0264220 [marine sediment metagenome]|uniref:Uncharacterized protein n=1 Tax=marine sediment metagenome TaxID=412755 RepID=A0A0F9X5N8_9ZZZZ
MKLEKMVLLAGTAIVLVWIMARCAVTVLT